MAGGDFAQLEWRHRASEVFSEVIDRFEHARLAARFRAARNMNLVRREEGLSAEIRLTTIGAEALEAWRGWGMRSDGQGGWDWAALRRRFRRRPETLDAAIWHGDTLCGLSCGRVSRGREVVRTDLVEAREGYHPLKRWIAPIAAELMAVFAFGFGAKAIRFHCPVPGARSRYEDLGFKFFDKRGEKPYSEMRLL
jgi:hypothetical protein